jgi:hypothetical protein
MITARPAAGHGHTIRNRPTLVTFPGLRRQGLPSLRPCVITQGRLAEQARNNSAAIPVTACPAGTCPRMDPYQEALKLSAARSD